METSKETAPGALRARRQIEMLQRQIEQLEAKLESMRDLLHKLESKAARYSLDKDPRRVYPEPVERVEPI